MVKPQVIILGSGSAVADESHDNTHLVICAGRQTVLVDCGSNPVVRLKRAGVDPVSLTDIILTHFHPDHVAGFALLLMNLWLLGKRDSLRIHGIEHTLARAKALLALHEWDHWPNFYPVEFNQLDAAPLRTVLSGADLNIKSSPVKHLIPTIGLRVEFLETGKVFAYSCDTEPCDAVIELAHRADLLLHEATGESLGHSTPEQAGEIARLASARELLLIHYRTIGADPTKLISPARAAAGCPVRLAVDFMRLEF